MNENLKDNIDEQYLYGVACVKFAKHLYEALAEKQKTISNSARNKFENNPNVVQIKSIANLYMGESIIQLHTLLNKKYRSIFSVVVAGSKEYNELEIIKSLYEQKKLHMYRHKFIAHIDIKMKGSPPIGKIFSTYKADVVSDTLLIYEKISESGYKFGNNFILDNFENSFESLNALLNINYKD